jgi:hypothetical protein
MNKIAIVVLLATILLSASVSTAVEDSTFAVGEKWAFGKEIDFMEEGSSEISELENNITELMSGSEAEMVKNATSIELTSFDLDNEAILGFYHIGEVIDNFDQRIHMRTEQSLYSHTVIDTKFTSMFPKEGTHDVRLEVRCSEEDDECEDPEINLLDNTTGEHLALQELSTQIGGSMHYVAKITQDTWWTADSHELAKTDVTIEFATSGGINIRNVPNLTIDGDSLYAASEKVLDEGEGDEAFSTCEEEEYSSVCYETIDIKLETAVFEVSSKASVHLIFDFGDDQMNVLDLPLDENKYWDGDISHLTISGDVGGQVDIAKPQLSLCPDLDCDQLPEMQELYSELTNAIQELHDNEEFSITVDRDGDGLPDVITEWNDLFPMYIPETWMDQIFQEMVDQIACEDDESAQEGEDCDETAEEEFEKLNLRIENNRFAFGPYALHEIEDFEPIPYQFETGEKETATASDGTEYEGYQVFPTDECSENNPDKDACNDEEDDGDGGVIPGSRAGEEDYNDCEGDPFCDSEIIWFHDAKTGHPAYSNMDMPNLREDGYRIEMMPMDPAIADAQVAANADIDNPKKTTLIKIPEVVEEDSLLPGFGIMAAGSSLLFVSRRFKS